MSIDLPPEELAWAQARVEAGEAGEAESLSAYFRELAARQRHEAKDMKRLEGLLEEGLASGIDPRSVDQIFADVRAKYDL